jgi:hypothetical protein
LKRDDLTNPLVFSDFIGYFWKHIFERGVIADSVGAYSSMQLAQIYKDMVCAINSVSVKTIPIFRRELIYPIVLSRREIEDNLANLAYGDGLVYGTQNEFSPAIGEVILFGQKYAKKEKLSATISGQNIPIISGKTVAMNSLYGATELLLSGVDFVINGEKIRFKENPFEGGKFPIRDVVRDDGEADQEIVVWLMDVDIEKFDLFRNFGGIFTAKIESSEQYRSLCLSIFDLISHGFSNRKVQTFLSCACGCPVIKESTETVVELHASKTNQLEIEWVETDKNLYFIPEEQRPLLNPKIIVGANLPFGTPLTEIVKVIDPKKEKKWWNNFESIPAEITFSDERIKKISFPNKMTTVQKGSWGVKFNIIGDETSKNAFWSNLNGWIKMNQDALNNFDDTINPAEFFSKHLANSSILPIQVDLQYVKDKDFLFKSILRPFDALLGIIPVYIFVYLMLKTSTDDTYMTPSNFSESLDVSSRSPGIQLDQYPEGDNELANELILIKYRSKCST